MRKHSWIYYDTHHDEIVLVRRSHRRDIDPSYDVLVYDSDGDIRDNYIIKKKYCRGRYLYLGGLNTKGRPGKRGNFKRVFMPGTGFTEVRIP